jgi:hypothetical protein
MSGVWKKLLQGYVNDIRGIEGDVMEITRSSGRN